MPRDNARDDEQTDSAARRVARRAASELRNMGSETQDVDDPPVTTDNGNSPRPDSAPGGVNDGRRATGGGSSDSSDSSESTADDEDDESDTDRTTEPGAPSDINQTRRADSTSAGDTTQNPNPDERLPDDGETGLGDAPDSPEDAQRQAVSSQLEKEFIRSNNDITSRDQVDVENVRRTDDGGLTGDVVLTEAGREAVAQANRESIRSRGTTGREFAQREVEISQARAEDAFAGDVRSDQFAREQLREEFARRDESLDASDVDLDVTESGVEVSLSEGGEQRQAVAQAASATEFSQDDLTATVTEDGETSVQLTEEALRERVASENDDVAADDLRVVEREFEGASERREGSTQRQVTLTDDAERERFRAAVEEENPNASEIDITRENGDLTADITGEGDVDRLVRLGENFVDSPVSSTAEGTTDIVTDSVDAVGEFGAESIDAVTNPVRTTESVAEDLVGAANQEVSDIASGISDAEDTLSGVAANPLDAAGDVGEDLFSGVADAGEGVASFAGEVGNRGDAITSSAAFAPIAGTASAAALAEPTPFGEAAVGAGAVIGAGVLTAAVAGDEIARTTNDLTQGESSVSEGELPVQAPNQAASELEVGEQDTSELDVGDVQPTSELDVGETFSVSELSVPARGSRSGEQSIPGLSLQQLQQGQQQRREEDSPREISEEDIQDPFAEPDQVPPSTRERMQREDLFTPAREFPTGESAVVGRDTTADGNQTDATTPEVEAGQNAGTGQGSGVTSGPGLVPGVDRDVVPGALSRSNVRGRTALGSQARTALDARSALETQTQTDVSSTAALTNTVATGFPNSFAQPTGQAFEFSPGTGEGDGSSRSADRPRLPSLSDVESGSDDVDGFSVENVFPTGFRDFSV